MDDIELLFVGGAPRSGTTLLQKILNGHHLIYGGPEFDVIPHIMELRNLIQSKIEIDRISHYVDAKGADQAVSRFVYNMLTHKDDRQGVRILSEKTPSNSKVFKSLLEVFPRSKCLMIIRDPRAAIASMLEVGRRHALAGLQVPFVCQNSLNAIGDYNDHVAPVLSLMTHPRLKLIYFRDLVTRPDEVMQDVFNFIGVEHEMDALRISEKRFDYANRGVEHFVTAAQKRSDIDIANIEKWRQSLLQRDIEIVSRYCLRADILDQYQLPPQQKITRRMIGTLLLDKLKNRTF